MITVVYGGGSVGLMGVLADTVLESGGRIVGVIPAALATEELLHPGVPQMHVVASMHARKAKMNELADAFIALPGGYGTLEELFEVVTWAQLGLHHKPIGILNVCGYFDALESFLDHATEQGFLKPKHRRLLVIDDQAIRLVDALSKLRPPAEPLRMSIEQA
jgi:uncharacterized protein (TIGR00730 family)